MAFCVTDRTAEFISLLSFVACTEAETATCKAGEETNEGRKSRPGAEICTG